MCLLIDHPAGTLFDRDDIVDFFDHNSDGIGVMYAEKNPETGADTLYTKKLLPANGDDAYDFYLTNCAGRDCVIHFRLQTHGDIDLVNCHPYFVQKEDHPIALMHNGILPYGNDSDKTKSDTWHYIKDYLTPLLSEFPQLFMRAEFIAMLEEHIGDSNKFVILDAYGNKAIVNASAFVMYKGALLSNTYAWTSARGGYTSSRSRSKGRSVLDSYFDNDDYLAPQTTTTAPLVLGPVSTVKSDFIADFFIVLKDLDEDLYHLVPYTVASEMFDTLGAQAADEWLNQVDEGVYQIEVVVSDLVEFGGMSVLNAELYLASFEDEESEPSKEGKAA